MNRAWLKASLRRWRRKRAYRRRRFLVHQRYGRQELIAKWAVKVREAEDKIALREQQLAAPTVYRGVAAGISRPTVSFGPLGELRAVTVHHSAAPRARTLLEALRLNRQFDRQHRDQGWGGLGYHETIDDYGRLYIGPRGMGRLKGAHVGGENTGNYGLLVHGNYETDEPTEKALQALKWRIHHGHEVGLLDLRGVPVKGHRDWPPPGGNTACPGRHLYPRLKDL